MFSRLKTPTDRIDYSFEPIATPWIHPTTNVASLVFIQSISDIIYKDHGVDISAEELRWKDMAYPGEGSKRPAEVVDLTEAEGKDTEDLRKKPKPGGQPECIVCSQFPYNSFVGVCGHSICAFCVESIESPWCPVCRMDAPKYMPNYQMRDMLQVAYPDQWAERESIWEESKPEGVIKRLKAKYADFCIRSNASKAEQAIVCEFAEECLQSVELKPTFDRWFDATQMSVLKIPAPVGGSYMCGKQPLM